MNPQLLTICATTHWCARARTHTHTHIHTHIHTHTHTHVHTHIYLEITSCDGAALFLGQGYRYWWIHSSWAYVPWLIHSHKHAHNHTRTHTYTRTHTRTHIRMHTHLSWDKKLSRCSLILWVRPQLLINPLLLIISAWTIHSHTHAHTHTHIHTHTYTHTLTNEGHSHWWIHSFWSYVLRHNDSHTHTHRHTHINTHTHMHTHISWEFFLSQCSHILWVGP